MTIRDAYALYRTLVDEGSDAFLTPANFVSRYAQARRGWLKAKAQEPETEYVKRLLAPFRGEPKRIVGTDDGIPLSALPDVAFIRAVTADFDGAVPLKNRPCRPLLHDSYAVSYDDPTRRPDDWFPAYREDADRLFIESTNTPATVTIYYLQDLPLPILTSTEASTLAESDRAVDEILNRLAGRQDLTLQNSRYAQETGREIPVGEQNT